MSSILLADRVPRTASTVHRGAAVLLGSPFVLAGIAITALVVSGAHDQPALATIGGRIAIYCVATVFLVCGLLLVRHGIGGIRRERQLQPLRTMHLEEPWRWDHAWDRRVELVVGRPAALQDHAEVEATPRCVQERAVTRGSGTSRSTTIECHEVARVPLTIEDVREGTRRYLRVRGVPPVDTLPTGLSETPSRYWELEIVSQVPGIDWRARFLVPVY